MTNEQKTRIDAAFNEGGDVLRFFSFGEPTSIHCQIYHNSRLAEQAVINSGRPKFIQAARRDVNGYTQEFPE